MTSRIDALIPPTRHAGTRSDSEAARAAVEAEQQAADRRRAARVVAACARDAAEFRTLANMLGIEPADLVAARDASPPRRRRHRAA